MPNDSSLDRLIVRGFRSIRELDLALSSDVTALVGANGSGKSNIVSALEVVSRLWEGGHEAYFTRHGGMSSLRFAGPDAPDATHIEIHGQQIDGVRHGYRVTLTPSVRDDADLPVIGNERLYWEEGTYSRPFDEYLPGNLQALKDSNDWRLRQFVENVLPVVSGCRVFHFDDVSQDAPSKGWSTPGDDLALRSNAENIAAYLLRVRDEHPLNYRRIVTAVAATAPFFDDFVLKPGGSGRIRLRWRQKGLDRVFTAHEMSDGTLRFACLATLLLGPDRPSTIILDEPELGLHPAAIHILAEIIRIAAQDSRRVIVATQSVTLLSQFDVTEIAVVERVNGATVVTRPDEDRLAEFLEEYSLGSLWEMNLLGGRPTPERLEG